MKTTLDFLKQLHKNNNREWFKANKESYDSSEEVFKQFALDLGEKMKGHDELEDTGTKIYRIYRDVRFSLNKTPYNIHRSVHYTRATAARRGGYYVRVQSGETFLAGGFWKPSSEDLLLIRKQIEQDPDTLRAILNEPSLKSYFGEMQGDHVKTTPKGFSKDSPSIDLIRYKGFILVHRFTDEEVKAADFIDQVNAGFKRMRPFLDYMSEILTTDLNGESLID